MIGVRVPTSLVLLLLAVSALASSTSGPCADGAISAGVGQLCDDSCPCDATRGSGAASRETWMEGMEMWMAPPGDVECRSTNAGMRCLPASAETARGTCGNPGQPCCLGAPCEQNPDAEILYTCQVSAVIMQRCIDVNSRLQKSLRRHCHAIYTAMLPKV